VKYSAIAGARGLPSGVRNCCNRCARNDVSSTGLSCVRVSIMLSVPSSSSSTRGVKTCSRCAPAFSAVRMPRAALSPAPRRRKGGGASCRHRCAAGGRKGKAVRAVRLLATCWRLLASHVCGEDEQRSEQARLRSCVLRRGTAPCVCSPRAGAVLATRMSAVRSELLPAQSSSEAVTARTQSRTTGTVRLLCCTAAPS
jgi:hypothetical protein